MVFKKGLKKLNLSRKGKSNMLGKKAPKAFQRVPRQWMTGIPRYQFVKLKYSDYRAFNTTTTPDVRAWALNGMYDPDITGTGHQPLAFDEYSNLYYKYTVVGCKVRITLSSTGGWPCLVMRTSRTSTSSVGIAGQKEKPGARSINATVGGVGRTVEQYYPIHQMFGMSKNTILDDGDYSAAYTANPAKLWYLITACQDMGETGTAAGSYHVTLTYYCRFSEPRNITQS